MVWEFNTSNNDHDVFSEQFDAAGDAIAGSAAPVEISGLFATQPCVAYLTVADAHLVVFQLADPNFGNRQMIYSRRFDAATAIVGPYELLSNPFLPGDNRAPSIGTDPGTDPATPHETTPDEPAPARDQRGLAAQSADLLANRPTVSAQSKWKMNGLSSMRYLRTRRRGSRIMR